MNDAIRRKIDEAQREHGTFSTPHTIGEILGTAAEMGYQVGDDGETVFGWTDATPEGEVDWRVRARPRTERCW